MRAADERVDVHQVARLVPRGHQPLRRLPRHVQEALVDGAADGRVPVCREVQEERLLLEEGACQRLLAAYDGEPVSRLPARFAYSRRLVAVLCGATFLHLARQSGHAGATGGETLDSTPSLGDCYQRVRAGSLSLATGEGRWGFGLALMKDSFAL